MAAAIKQGREDRAEAERLRRAEEKRRIEESGRKAEYERKAKAVKALAQQWQESKLLRALKRSAASALPSRSSRITFTATRRSRDASDAA
jgi:hypothetical protein